MCWVLLLLAFICAGQMESRIELGTTKFRGADFARDDVATPADALVICPASWLDSLQPWLRHRERQGHRLALHTTPPTRDGIRSAILRTAAGGQLKYVVLVGDVHPAWPKAPATGQIGIPTHYATAMVNLHWGSEPMLATDQDFADPDNNGVPDLAVGRLSVDSRTELNALIEKILRYEQSIPSGAWQRRIQFVAGSGGFGPIVDTVIETTARSFITEGIPAEYRTSMAYANWRSPYCPNPYRFPQIAARGMNTGCLFWVYLGHGSPDQLDQIRLNDRPESRLPIFTGEHASTIASPGGLPVALLWACYTGAYDQPQDCLAEVLLRQPRGPVAVLAGSRVTMPYGMAALGNGLLQAIFEEQHVVLGDAILRAQRLALAETAAGEPRETEGFSQTVSDHAEARRALDLLARAISPVKDQLHRERREHVQMFNLLGDPMLRLAIPHAVTVQTGARAEAGEAIQVQGEAPFAGEALIELVCRRDRNKHRLAQRRRFDDSPDGLAEMDRTYREANDGVWAMRRRTINSGPFEIALVTPTDCRGPCHVRILLKATDRVAIGAADIYVRSAATSASAED